MSTHAWTLDALTMTAVAPNWSMATCPVSMRMTWRSSDKCPNLSKGISATKSFPKRDPTLQRLGARGPSPSLSNLTNAMSAPRAMTSSVCQMAWTGRARHNKPRERKATPCSTCHAERQPSVPRQRQKEETTSVPSSMKHERTLCKDTKFFDVTERGDPKKT